MSIPDILDKIIQIDEFKNFINANIRLEPVTLLKADNVAELLEFYMGKNTPERQDFIINNLRVEIDAVEETAEETAVGEAVLA